VALHHRAGEHLDVVEFLPTSVEVPHIVDGPDVLLGEHLTEALDGRHRRPRTDLGGETVGPAALLVLVPVVGGDVLIGALHLHAAVAGEVGRAM
jgi:hypothetical protein